MTMFSAENRRFYGGYGGEGFSQGYGFSDLITNMAEDDSRTDDTTTLNNESSSKNDRDDEGWLQLSIGGGHSHDHHDQKNYGPGLTELELMPSSSINITDSTHSQIGPLAAPRPEFRAPRPATTTGFISPSSFYLQHHPGSSNLNFPHHQEINWAFRPIPISIATASSSSYSSSMAPGSYFPRPFQLYAGVDLAAPPAPGLDFRVIQPPRRPHSGIWFMLQASQNQEKEPFLPQISKSYLRIKDGRMTIRLVIKYLVNKLSLENESEIEIRCKGQRLLPFLTLQHVRDNIWNSSSQTDFITLLPNSSTTHHIMVLHYARTSSSN